MSKQQKTEKERKTSKRNTSEVMRSVASSVDFIKSQIASDLVEAKNKKLIDLSQDDLRKIVSVVEGSITKSFIKTASQIESTL